MSKNKSTVCDVPEQIITRHTLSEIKKRNIRILLAEDNIVNQKVALNILGKFGYRVDAVIDGIEALQSLDKTQYDIVLMDVQMPEMDGLTATKIIREKERQNGKHIPIIALTAYAMKGDKEQCIEAGMDDYISKPFNPKMLQQIIDKFIKNSTENNGDIFMISNNKDIFDSSFLMNRVENDEKLFFEIIELFLIDTQLQLENLKSALDSKDTAQVKFITHTIKGSASNVGSNSIKDIAMQIQTSIEEDNLDKTSSLYKTLEDEFEKLKIVLNEYEPNVI
jgi:CheY-like chemotaxis protein/HPt (histidine-containing phosphotransfer) domain-containing protein